MKDKDILQSKELKINDLIIDCYCSMMSIHARSKGKEFTFQSVCCPEKHKCVDLFVQPIYIKGGGGHWVILTNVLNDNPDEVNRLDSNWSSVDILDSGNENYPVGKVYSSVKAYSKGHHIIQSPTTER